MIKYRTTHRYKGACTIVRAYDGTKRIGVGAACETLQRGERILQVDKAFVEGSHQRQGVGTKIYERLAQDACRRGIPLASSPKWARSRYSTGFWLKQEAKQRAAERDEGVYVLRPCESDLSYDFKEMFKSPWYYVGVGGFLLLLFSGKKASAQAPKLGPKQQAIADAVVAEAQRQGVDHRIALAFTEIESNFKNVTNGISYGPLQVNAKFYDGPANDLMGPKGISEGIRILKMYLRAAHGDPELARIMYLCGIAGSKDPTKCSEATKSRVRTKWRSVAPKWGL